jgi:ketosteroid isomerase-like protein
MSRFHSVRSSIIGFAVISMICWASAAAVPDLAGLESPRGAFDHFIAAFNALDWESFRACFAEDATVFNPDILEVASLHRLDGRAAIERTFQAVFGSKHSPGIVAENVRVQQFQDAAIITFEFKRPGNSFGRRTIVLHHEGKSWLIVHIHASNAMRAPN